MDEQAAGVLDRECLCCQSKAEQWLRLISILMNANWHICYGGIAVQTLQLAWLINYPAAGGSLEMEAGVWGVGRLPLEWAAEIKWQKMVQNQNLIQSLYLIRLD